MLKMFFINDSYILNFNKYFSKIELIIGIEESESDLVCNMIFVG